MDDLPSQGGDREPSRWPPRLLVIAILILLAIVVIRHLPETRAAPPHRPAAAVSAGPVQLAGLGSGAAGLLDKAYGVAGRSAACLVTGRPNLLIQGISAPGGTGPMVTRTHVKPGHCVQEFPGRGSRGRRSCECVH